MAGFKLDGGPLSGVSASTLELLGQQAKSATAMFPDHLLRQIEEMTRLDTLSSAAARHIDETCNAYRAITAAGEQFEKANHAASEVVLGMGKAREALLQNHIGDLLRSHDLYTKAGGMALDPALARAAREFGHTSSGKLVEDIGRAVGAFSSTATAFTEMQRSLTAQWSAISEHLAEQGRLMSRLGPLLLDLETLGVDAREAHARQIRQARVIADAGWPLPLDADGADLASAVRTARRKGARALDRWMIRFYEKDDGAALRELRARLQRRFSKVWFKRWATTVDDIFDGIDNRRFHRASLALPILDRLATRAAGINTGRMKEDTWSKVPRPGGQLLVDVLWVSVGRFLEHTWAFAPFSAGRPARSNRHWILHGYATTRRKSDALRLLLALDLASGIVVHIRRRERRKAKSRDSKVR